MPSFQRIIPALLWMATEGRSLPVVACSSTLSENRYQMHAFLLKTVARGPPKTRQGVMMTSFRKLHFAEKVNPPKRIVHSD